MKAILRMINKIDKPERLFLGELLIERVQDKLTADQLQQCYAALYKQNLLIH
jgi:hypothetical protein